MLVEVSQEERRELLQEKNSLLSVLAALDRHLKSLPYNTKIPFARYFYNPVSNYTKTIIRLRLVNIGEYSHRLRRIIVKY